MGLQAPGPPQNILNFDPGPRGEGRLGEVGCGVESTAVMTSGQIWCRSARPGQIRAHIGLRRGRQASAKLAATSRCRVGRGEVLEGGRCERGLGEVSCSEHVPDPGTRRLQRSRSRQ